MDADDSENRYMGTEKHVYNPIKLISVFDPTADRTNCNGCLRLSENPYIIAGNYRVVLGRTSVRKAADQSSTSGECAVESVVQTGVPSSIYGKSKSKSQIYSSNKLQEIWLEFGLRNSNCEPNHRDK
ncbi:Hypothetical protein CINCED_3A003400 [Cinara cedri]|uniref:Uncharacterized protein n=1 Tax=Cinara cedri TaxID=506608 RepID=A0A5E4NP20_9HEMI|nr:Hypothetical protein CINCED_3A003400 [Cinara cedri]